MAEEWEPSNGSRLLAGSGGSTGGSAAPAPCLEMASVRVTAVNGTYLLDNTTSPYRVGAFLYTFEVDAAHPLRVISSTCNATMTGTTVVNGTQGGPYHGLPHYSGTVTVDFSACKDGTMFTLHCGYHGVMNAPDRLTQSNTCSAPPLACLPGSYRTASAKCATCAPGRFSNTTDAPQCLLCADGTYTNGSSTHTACFTETHKHDSFDAAFAGAMALFGLAWAVLMYNGYIKEDVTQQGAHFELGSLSSRNRRDDSDDTGGASDTQTVLFPRRASRAYRQLATANDDVVLRF